MVALRNFTHADAPALRRFKHAAMPAEEVRAMIDAWNSLEYQGRYFEMFAIISDGQLVGMLSLYQLSASVISLGPEVFPPFRGQGLGKAAMLQALEVARRKGYSIAAQQVRSDNLPSIALHRSLGFETDDSVYTNRKGNQVRIFLMALSSQAGA